MNKCLRLAAAARLSLQLDHGTRHKTVGRDADRIFEEAMPLGLELLLVGWELAERLELYLE